MGFIKQNWKQGLTIVFSAAVGGLLILGKITPVEAVGAGSLCALFGIHLEPVTYGSKP